MNLPDEIIIRKEEPIMAEEATQLIQGFISENSELDGIYRIQLEEILNYIKTDINMNANDTIDDSNLF